MQEKWGREAWDGFLGAEEIEPREKQVEEMVGELVRHARIVGLEEGRRVSMREEVEARERLNFATDGRHNK